MSKRIHLSIDLVELSRLSDAQLARLLGGSRGSCPTPSLARLAVDKLLVLGDGVIPIGKPCEGFSYQTGCPGHEFVADPDVPLHLQR